MTNLAWRRRFFIDCFTFKWFTFPVFPDLHSASVGFPPLNQGSSLLFSCSSFTAFDLYHQDPAVSAREDIHGAVRGGASAA